MEKDSIFKGDLTKQLAGAGLATLLFAAPAMAADGTPAGQDDAKVASPHPEKTKTARSEAITPGELDRKLSEQSGKIKFLIDEAQSVRHKETLDAINALAPKLEHDWIDKFLTVLSFASSLAAFFSIRQARKYKDEQEKGVREQKEALKKLNASTHNIEIVTRKSEAASYMARQSLEEQKAIIRANRTERALERVIKTNRAERIGAFPEMYHYITERIQSAQNTVVITMPFYQLGVLGSPHGLHDFHHTLCERFDNAAGSGKPQLVFITYDDESRCAMARKRYSRAIYALDTLDDTPQSKKLESIFSKDVWKKLWDRLEDFQEKLNEHEGSREILARLAEEQTEWLRMQLSQDKNAFEARIDDRIKEHEKSGGGTITYKKAMDLMFIEEYLAQNGSERNKKPFSAPDKELFTALHEVRDAFSEAVEDQEKIYFDPDKLWNNTGTTWPRGGAIIKVPRGELKKIEKTFDNEMTVCIDGLEVIRAFSSLIPTGNLRKNRLVSESGDGVIQDYKNQLSDLFEIADLRQIPEDILIEIANRMPGIDSIEEWLTTPNPEV